MLRKIIKAVTATATVVTTVAKFCKKHPGITHAVVDKIKDKVLYDPPKNNSHYSYTYTSYSNADDENNKNPTN